MTRSLDRAPLVRRLLPALFALLLASHLGACNDDGVEADDDSPVSTSDNAEPLEKATVLRPSLCTTVLCKVGTQCNPSTGRCERPGTDVPEIVPIGSLCGVCPKGTVCTVACTNSFPPNCYNQCVPR